MAMATKETSMHELHHHSRRDFLKAVGLGALALPLAAAAQECVKRPNVVLIMADDLGLEGLQCYGGASYETPLLDAMAVKGMQFTHCYSQPLCTPSRVKIMTGRSNARNYRDFGDLDPNEVTFGNIMKQAGYKTCIAGKWQLCGPEGNAHKGTFPKEAGFDESCMWAYDHDLPKEARASYTFFGEKIKKTSRYWNPSIIKNGDYVPTTTNDFGPDIFTKFITDFIDKNREDPFFVYYPMALTHNPFVPTPLSEDQSDKAKKGSGTRFFGDMIHYTGVLIDRIIQKLEETGLAENTLVLFTTDNGSHASVTSRMADRAVFGGKGLPVDAGCHVPLIAYWKGVIPPATISTDLVDFSDFLPTLAEIAGTFPPNDREYDGQSILPQLLGQPAPKRDCVVVHYDKNPDAAKPAFWRVRFAYDGRFKLYDDGRFYEPPKDWNETRSLYNTPLSNDAIAAKKELEAALARLPKWRPNNSHFKGQRSPAMQKFLNKHERKNATR
jgi:arylsulfatase A